MHAWEAIQTTVDYIEEHTQETIKIEELARLAALSPFYYQRLFKRLVKTSVNDYIKLRRLAQSSKEVLESNQRILDIALKYQFSNHANYSRAFKDVYGVTPDECRKNKIPLNHFVKPELLLNYVMMDEGVPLITDGIVIEITRRFEEERYFVGIEKEISIEELMSSEATGVASINYIWEELRSRMKDIPHIAEGKKEFNAIYLGTAREGNCMYMAGIEVEDNIEVVGFTTFVLPAQEYLVTEFEAESFDELVNTAVYKADDFTARWQKKHKLITTGPFAAGIYGPRDGEVAYLEHLITVKDEE
ncbi:AraC family transcriptional regulator [Breznakia pachnodae]|uniref:AraC-like DNA-binding protein/predicted transcriptional regulator YdeE n=1 Tax=Breznakia pachnodae TaxID=265178 RepID=A0ABU0DZ31_9FIRM|nr:AraC family transcriptional regulator [Breznakia pachnodae]MDQ0359887.1 AraC-like DNA-binding protein/predicted transcriptional regulator YdeE [Breznakia pachnodae]